MTTFALLARNLSYYWRTNLAVMAAVLAGTAVIGGALVVGDSVRGSLRQLSLNRLGKIDDALLSPTFFREELADALASRPDVQSRFSAVAPTLLLNGTFVTNESGNSRRAAKVQVFGIDDRLWKLIDHGSAPLPSGQEAILNDRLARQLNVSEGADVSLWLQLPSLIPRESLLGKREGDFREIPFKVRRVLDRSMGAGRLAFSPTQQLPLNAFVALSTLQQGLGLYRQERSRRNPAVAPSRINTLFVAAKSPADQFGATAVDAAHVLDDELAGTTSLADLGLRIVIDSARGYLSLESEHQILSDIFAKAGIETASRLGMATSPVLAYLANELINAKDPHKVSMYSVVAGLDPVTSKTPPFGPFAWDSQPPEHPLGADEIAINDWLAHDLAAKVGDTVRLRYHVVGSHGELPEEEKSLRVAGILKLDGTAADDRGLVPTVKGITDAKTLRDWDQPFPMQLNRISARDEEYWTKYKATPKSFVSLETAQELWGNRFGSLTSVRIAPNKGQTVEQASADFGRALLKSLTAAQTGMRFQPVKFQGVQAAVGSNDFSQLFVAFSFFLILAATLLVGLVFRLGIEQRGPAVGLLLAVGFTPQKLRRLFLLEGLALVIVGSLLGSAAAVAYANLMVYGLKTWWNRAIGTELLSVYVVPASLATGFVASLAISALAVLWGLRQLRLLSTRELLSGAMEPQRAAGHRRRRGARARRMGSALALFAVASLVAGVGGLIPKGEAFEGITWNVVLFFVDGMAILAAGVLLLAGSLDVEHSMAVRGRGIAGMARLGARNTARHRQRSITSVSMIAAATFVIVAVGAGRRNPAVETPDRNSGNGGFRLVAESTEPILFDLNSLQGRNKLDLHVPPQSADAAILASSKIFSFRVKPGEDASCLNVYQTRLPTILGLPKPFLERGGFRLIGAREANPWPLLEQSEQDGSIPVFGDANTLQYSLHKGVGDTIAVPDEAHPKARLRIAGMLDGSVFQGVLLMSEANFQRLYPDVSGYRYFLLEVPGTAADADRLSTLLETQLAPFGFDAEPVVDRLAAFLAVQNTYLATFQTLGGLGLLLGTLGLAIVMIRNVLERRNELALLSALGFRRSSLAWLILVETAVLLVCGLLTGAVAALVAMAPHLSSTGADIRWGSLALILGLVFVVGMLASLAASIQAARTPILEGLRSE
jgi:ABC-type antimicrobial peptide transport system permease subunit